MATGSAQTRNQLLFLGLFVSYFGMTVTEEYYATFGIKYHFLNVGISHALQKGIGLFFWDPFSFLMYVAMALCILCADRGVKFRVRSLEFRPIIYLVVASLLVFVFGYSNSIRIGQETARRDLGVETSKLPRLSQLITSKPNKKTMYEAVAPNIDEGRYRVLLMKDSQLIIFKATKTPLEVAFPSLVSLRMEGDNAFILEPQ